MSIDGSRGVIQSIGEVLTLWSTLPFAGMLLSIALLPLLAPRFWHHNYPKVSAFWAAVFVVPFVLTFRGDAVHEVAHIFLADYVPFVILLAGLFTVSGGIVVEGRLAGTPTVNTAYLAAGTLIASWIGTTGASMLLIRPLLRANELRRHRHHVVVFFIFLVSNVGGCLTPLGDPPLFLGFLRGVPFFWTMHLVPELALVGGGLLAAFFAVDSILHRRELREGAIAAVPLGPGRTIRVEGLGNIVWMAGIVLAVLGSGLWKAGSVRVLGVEMDVAGLVRDGVIVIMAGASLLFTPASLRRDNGFSWEPMREVSILFAGIFATIVPALAILKAGEAGALGAVLAFVREPAHYFWATGFLSSFLDNAPTYLAFLTLEVGKLYPGLDMSSAVARLVVEHPAGLSAVSAGAVFMGACTYIGNAPNFMVKAIAEESGVEMPSFFGYVVKWTLPVLIPLFALTTWWCF